MGGIPMMLDPLTRAILGLISSGVLVLSIRLLGGQSRLGVVVLVIGILLLSEVVSGGVISGVISTVLGLGP